MFNYTFVAKKKKNILNLHNARIRHQREFLHPRFQSFSASVQNVPAWTNSHFRVSERVISLMIQPFKGLKEEAREKEVEQRGRERDKERGGARGGRQIKRKVS